MLLSLHAHIIKDQRNGSNRFRKMCLHHHKYFCLMFLTIPPRFQPGTHSAKRPLQTLFTLPALAHTHTTLRNLRHHVAVFIWTLLMTPLIAKPLQVCQSMTIVTPCAKQMLAFVVLVHTSGTNVRSMILVPVVVREIIIFCFVSVNLA